MRRLSAPFPVIVVALSWWLVGCSGEDQPPVLGPSGLGGEVSDEPADVGGEGGAKSDPINTDPNVGFLDSVGGVALDKNDFVICSLESPTVVADLAVEEPVTRLVGYVSPVTDKMIYFLAGGVYGVEQGPIAPPAVCSSVDGFTMEPETGALFFQCSGEWYDEAGTSISDCSGQLYIGRQNDLLCRVVSDAAINEVVISLTDRTTGAVLSGPTTHGSYLEAFRAREDGGFWYISPAQNSLRRITADGDAEEFTYHAPPSGWGDIGQFGLSPDLTFYRAMYKLSDVSMAGVARTRLDSYVVWKGQGACSIRGGVGAFIFYP